MGQAMSYWVKYVAGMILILVSLQIETLTKLKKRLRQKNAIYLLTRCNAPVQIAADVPNQPSPDKTQLCLRIPRTLKIRLEKLAKQRGETVTELVEYLLHKQTKNVELDAKDHRKIADSIERAKRN